MNFSTEEKAAKIDTKNVAASSEAAGKET